MLRLYQVHWFNRGTKSIGCINKLFTEKQAALVVAQGNQRNNGFIYWKMLYVPSQPSKLRSQIKNGVGDYLDDDRTNQI